MAQMRRTDGSCFWIDTTEVTVAQYSAFLAAPSHAPQDVVCSGNVSGGGLPAFEPPASCTVAGLPGGKFMTADGGVRVLDGGAPGGNLPMTCVDWCDALAFCVWSGKDLCKDDGTTNTAVALQTRSDWFQACIAGDTRNKLSCVSPCDYSSCNGSSSGNGQIEPVGTVTGCAVPSANGGPTIRDLSGNVSEWTSWCNRSTGSADCMTRGGFYASGDTVISCVAAQFAPRATALATVGFRCCKDSRLADGG